MNSLDAAIIILLAAFFADYRSKSAVFNLIVAGSILGAYLIGLSISAGVAQGLATDSSKGIATIVITGLLVLAAAVISRFFANKARMKFLTSKWYRVDRLGMIPTKIVAAVFIVWVLAQSLVHIPFLSLQYIARGSTVMITTNKLLPDTPIKGLAESIAPNQYKNLSPRDTFSLISRDNINPESEQFELMSELADSVVRITGKSCTGFSGGTGTVIEDGLILTAGHVAVGLSNMFVEFEDEVYPATPKLVSEDLEIAILEIAEHGRPEIPIRDESITSKESTVTLGFPYGDGIKSAEGTIEPKRSLSFSESKTDLTEETTYDMRFTDSFGAPGRSGSGVFDYDGNLVGVLVAGSRGGDVGVVVSSTVAQDLVDTAKGRISADRGGLCDRFQGYYD